MLCSKLHCIKVIRLKLVSHKIVSESGPTKAALGIDSVSPPKAEVSISLSLSLSLPRPPSLSTPSHSFTHSVSFPDSFSVCVLP